jgi:hypothetical protein
MRRREFITLLGGAAVAWPLAARAQQPTKIPHIGIIDDSLRWNAFRHGLRDLGYLEGGNVAFDYAYGDGVPERLAEAAAALVRRPVNVIALADTGKGERKAHWQERKEAYLAHLRTADEDILWVSLADKVHNARTILRDLRKPDIGEKVWARFNVALITISFVRHR